MVSIVVPVYKVEQYLHACVDSILAQSYQDIQLILVDDGSPDRCGEICDEYAQKDKRVLSLHKPNGGVSSARNYGLQFVEGEYVTFCDSDDMYASGWLDALVGAMEACKADVVVGNYRRISGSDIMDSASSHETGISEMEQPEMKVRYCIEKILTEKHAWEIWDRLFRTDIIRNNHITFCETCGNFAEDLGFTLSYSLCADYVISIEAAGYLYRMREGSMMQTSIHRAKLDSVNEVFLHIEPTARAVLPEELADRVLPVLHFLIMHEQYMVALREGNYRSAAEEMGRIRRIDAWEAWVRRIIKSRKELVTWFGKYQAERILLLMHFCLHRDGFRYRVERKIFYMLKNKMEDCYGNDE